MTTPHDVVPVPESPTYSAPPLPLIDEDVGAEEASSRKSTRAAPASKTPICCGICAACKAGVSVVSRLSRARSAGIAGVALAFALASYTSDPDARAAELTAAQDPPAGQGVMCAWVFYAVATEVGDRCFPDEDPAYHAEETHRSVAEIDAFILANSKITPERLASLKKQQAHIGAPKGLLCHGELVDIYRAFQKAGVEKLRANADKMVARPGPPTIGDCT